MLPRLVLAAIIEEAREALTHYEQNSPVMTVEFYMITAAVILFGALSLIIRNCLKTKKTPSEHTPKRSDHFLKSNSKVEDLIPISEAEQEDEVMDYHKFTKEMKFALNDSGILVTSTPGQSSMVETSKNSSGNSSKNSSLNTSSLKPSDRSVIDEKIFFLMKFVRPFVLSFLK